MCDDHQIGEAYRDIVRTYNWLFIMTHLLLEAHSTFGHCHEGHGLKKGHFYLCHNLSPLENHKKLVLFCCQVCLVLYVGYTKPKKGIWYRK